MWEELANASKYHEDTYGQIDHAAGEKGSALLKLLATRGLGCRNLQNIGEVHGALGVSKA